MEIAKSIIFAVAGCLIDPAKEILGYMYSYTESVRDINTKINGLNHTKNDVEKRMKRNESRNLEIPSVVPDWLEEVKVITALVRSFPSDVGGFNLKIRHAFAKEAPKIFEDIKRLVDDESRIKWIDDGLPLGEVGSMKASTSTSSSHHDEFESRQHTFLQALKVLESNHKSCMVALCGMGGVGKTTMMQKLIKVASEKKMFDFIIEATIGEKPDTSAIQKVVAAFLVLDVEKDDKATRAIKLRKCFEAHSAIGKKFLVVLDNVWQFIDLADIGLNEDVDFKILLTSQKREVCIEMGFEVDSILSVEILTNPEAQSFFLQYARISEDVDLDLDLSNIGDKIAIRCQGLPIAIKTIAHTLKGKKSKEVWEDALSRLNHHQLDECLHQIFEMSYNNLQKEETRSTLLLCGLCHKDLDTSIEHLVRYVWGLNLFSNVDTIQEARNRLSTHIERLIDANLLIKSLDSGGVKMHDLVHDFVLRMCSKGVHGSIVGDMSKWPTKDTSESCKWISFTCKDRFAFPRDCKYPNLLLLRLVDGNGSLQFHDDFYQEMGKLEVLVYQEMRCQVTVRSFRCSTNLRVLCFHQCYQEIDLSDIGDLFNLEVLSFDGCFNQKELPSTHGNLKNLRVLDLTSCDDLIINDGVFENLVKLEELYIRGTRLITTLSEHEVMLERPSGKEKFNKFINVNNDGLVTCLEKLVTLEIEVIDNKEGISFKKLRRFKISLGCYVREIEDWERRQEMQDSYENTLILVTNKGQLLDSGLNELFIRTEVLHLQVADIRDGLVESFYPHQASFYNLRVLKIFNCVDLRYLFTVGVANGLPKLERLIVSSCPILKTLLDSEHSGVEATKFQALKYLFLSELPQLKSFCNDVNTIEMPQLEALILESLPNFTSIYSSMSNDTSAMQPFLNKEIVIPRLKKMKICKMENLKEIWPSNDGEDRFSLLKEIQVEECQSLVSLFPKNPMSLLHHLEELLVVECCSIDVLFNINLGRVGEIEEVNSKLKSIYLWGLGNLREIWRVKGEKASNRCIIRFEALENIRIFRCESLTTVLPSTVNFDTKVTIHNDDWLGKFTRMEENLKVMHATYKAALRG